jgi:hypothetical protein
MEMIGEVQTRGAQVLNGIVVTATTTLSNNCSVVLVAPSSNTTVTLPVSPRPWQLVYTKKVNTGSGSFTLKGSGASLIDGTVSFTIAHNTKGQIVVVYDGTNWWRVV